MASRMASLGSWNLPVGFGPAEEVDVDAADLIGAELHVAGAEAWILRGRRLPVDERAQAIRGGFSKINGCRRKMGVIE
jgi:hypothetical protein